MARCLSKRKDTNFKANHNFVVFALVVVLDVCLSAKIRILKQITTSVQYECFLSRCLSKRKDTNFKANHNLFLTVNDGICDVCLSAKIRILKQITTRWPYFASFPRCLSKRKDTNFKANHNQLLKCVLIRGDVCLSAKIRILKQITTLMVRTGMKFLMFV